MNRPEFALQDAQLLAQPFALTPHDSGECRCVCGALMARWLRAGLELKCRRCKTALVIPWAGLTPQAGTAEPQAHGDCRCGCGSLMARWTAQGAELKCRRCKRVPVLPWRSLRPLRAGAGVKPLPGRE